MNESFLEAFARAAQTSVAYGVGAGFVRWLMRKREDDGHGSGIRGAVWALLGQIVLSCFVAYAAGAYLADEQMHDNRRGFYVCLAAFVAKDVLLAVIALAQQFGSDPVALIKRVREALKGVPK